MIYRVLTLAGAFFTVAILSVALYRIFFASRRAVLDRLEDSDVKTPGESSSPESGEGAREELYRVLGALGRAFSGRVYLDRLQKKLIQARILMKAEEFAGLSFFCGLGAMLLFYLFTTSIPLAVIAGLIGFKLPELVVDRRKLRRMTDLNRQLPDALAIISNGLRAGYSFIQALAVVSREMEPPIAGEFARVIRDNRLGKPMADVLRELSERTDSDDLDLVITALLIQRQVGGNLAEILDNIANTIRERVRIKGEIRTLTAQGRITAVIICLLPLVVAFLVFAVNPDYIMTLFREPVGLILAGGAFLMQMLGIMIIRKIININI